MIGKELYRKRANARLTLYDVCSLTGGEITPAGLSLIERGKRKPNLATLEVLAKALKLTITVSPRGVVVKGGRR